MVSNSVLFAIPFFLEKVGGPMRTAVVPQNPEMSIKLNPRSGGGPGNLSGSSTRFKRSKALNWNCTVSISQNSKLAQSII